VDIHLRLIDRAGDPQKARIVAFRRPPDGGVNDEPIAWLVIEDLRPGDTHRFAYDTGFGDPATDAPAIWIAATLQAAPGGPLDLDPGAATKLSLAGLARADIAMTGGGAAPFAFALENAVRA
jgi:hypothetical protein